jgi:2-oxoglutarate-dependent dioxygenase
MCNVWKSDRLVASIVLQESLGKLVAQIMDWPSVRIAQDDLIWKPPCVSTIDNNNSVVGFHQDSAYISSQFEPYENNSVTVWMALDDTDEETGCIQYAVGSHKWKVSEYVVQDEVSTTSTLLRIHS